MSNGLIAFVVLVALTAGWALMVFNRLVRSRSRMNSAYARVDVQLGLRHDLIPQLVSIARGYLQHERQTLQGVSFSRQRASDARRALGGDFGGPASVPVTAGVSSHPAGGRPHRTELLEALDRAESGLNRALARFAMVVDSYPELKADPGLAKLNEELSATEASIAVLRQAFNDAVTAYNDVVRRFPTSLVANGCGFTAAGLLRSPPKGGKRVLAMVDLP